MVVLSAAIVAAQMAAAPLIGFGFGLGYTLGSRTGYEIVFDLLRKGKVSEAKKLLSNVQNFAKQTGTESATAFGLSNFINDINSATPSNTQTINQAAQTQYVGGQPIQVQTSQLVSNSLYDIASGNIQQSQLDTTGLVSLENPNTKIGLSPKVAGFLNYYYALAKSLNKSITIQETTAAFPTNFSYQEKNQALQWLQAYEKATVIQRDFKRTPGAPKAKIPKIITYNRPQEALNLKFLAGQSQAKKQGLEQNVIAFKQQLSLQIGNLRRLKTVGISSGASIRDRRARARFVQRQKIGIAREIARIESIIRDLIKKVSNAQRLLRNFR